MKRAGRDYTLVKKRTRNKLALQKGKLNINRLERRKIGTVNQWNELPRETVDSVLLERLSPIADTGAQPAVCCLDIPPCRKGVLNTSPKPADLGKPSWCCRAMDQLLQRHQGVGFNAAPLVQLTGCWNTSAAPQSLPLAHALH
ncbi:Fc receptor-like protein 3 [Platysternon megacephalum]|uniref:Fc receptor-like protein 3 n=1 Tax=Platysternon megacephalum TaxID=55544 RepID=A0A4D9DQC1_9SAUR|nr:Fc receptor-like protein 3 [Platysternon megacephalum]